MNAITYRITDTIEDMTQAEHLQKVVWGMTPADILSATTMRWMIHIGGLLIGAWDNDNMIGFCIASVGKRDGKWILWSDMAGIHPEYQGQGIGYALKQHQKKWAYEQGYDEIRWTFDPMRCGNAFFNFHKLGVISQAYHQAFYGEMQDNINRGLPADRLEAIWKTKEETEIKRQVDSKSPFAVSSDDNTLQSNLVDASQIKIEIPYNLTQLKQDTPTLARYWQQAVSTAFTHYFTNGYTAFDFQRDEMRCWYNLHKNN